MATDGTGTASDDGDRSSVSLVGAIAIGIGGMVGGGIFAVLGLAAERAGGATPLSFLVAGVVAALTAVSYSKLSVRFRSAGGTVTFIDRVFGVDAVTGAVNVTLWCGYIATTALYAAAFGHYGAALAPGSLADSALAFKALAVIGVLLPWFVNLASAGLIAKTEDAIVAMKLVILLVVAVAGIPTADTARLDPASWPSPVSILAAGMLIFVAYEGFELIANASEDVERPEHTLPRAFAWAVGSVIVLYLAISTIVVAALTPDEIAAAAEYALAEAASSSLGRAGFVMVGVSALLATFSATNATLYGAARLSYSLALDRELPSEFRRRPWHRPFGLHVTAGLGAAIAVGLPLGSISSLASSIFLIVFTVVNAAAFVAGDDARVSRPLAAAGALACAASLVTLVVRDLSDDPTPVVLLGALLGTALLLERRVLRHHRDDADRRRAEQRPR